MRIAIITTSRADYGIYHSLLQAMAMEASVDYGMVVSGAHLYASHGYTIQAIEADGHPIWGKVTALPQSDAAADISKVMGTTLEGFAKVWAGLEADLDLVVCLGDRYEMFAAVAATIPFNLPVAHLHGGETTLGAMDDKFRHAITAMSTLHFTATQAYANRVQSIIGHKHGVFAVGAPGLDGLQHLALPTVKELDQQFGTNFQATTILVTLHPETINLLANEQNTRVLLEALTVLLPRYWVVITLPNADTQGNTIRRHLAAFARNQERVTVLESFGRLGYFAAMKYCAFLLGNTSSGLLEAAAFGKYTINLGRRQAGRVRGDNVIDVLAEVKEVLAAVRKIEALGMLYSGDNPYRITGEAGKNILREIITWKAAKKGDQI